MRLFSIITGIAACAVAAAAAAPAPPADADTLASRARTVLIEALAREQGFVKVHAAEALLELGDKAAPRRAFLAELPAAEALRPYRIGVWRVLAASSETPEERAKWLARIESVVLTPSSEDRLHAVESLGKLGVMPVTRVREAVEQMAKGPDADAVYPRWLLHLAGDRSAIPAIVAALDSTDPIARLRAGYVLRWLRVQDPATRAAIARAADREPPTAAGHAIILGAAVTLEADPSRMADWIAALENVILHGGPGARYDACQTLMHRATRSDLSRFAPLLDHPAGDARIGAAWAILHVARRDAAHMKK